MKTQFTILFLCICLIQCGQPIIADNIRDGESYDCVLMDKYKEPMPCGIFKVAVGLKFKMISTNGEFVSVIACPELYGKSFFARGKKYRLQLASDIKKCGNCQIHNSYEKSSLPTYYALKVEKLSE